LHSARRWFSQLGSPGVLGAHAEVNMVSNDNEVQKDLGFDPDSPDLKDPQVDPVGPAEAPQDDHDVNSDKRVDDKQYPPYGKQ
jgi:hypothetical protein